MRFPRIRRTMEPCLLALLQGAIKQSRQLQLVIKSFIQYISAQEMLIIQLDVLTVMEFCHVPFFPFRKVWFFEHLLRSRLIFLFFSSPAGPKERTTIAYQQFCRQLYHACLAYIYEPLKPAMTSPEVVRCPDGHFRRSIFSIGPYIADYPEQVWLSTIVSNWCPT
jgi:hypothetical protein